jgi:ribonucleoside-diphosphate reductase subunit M1
VELGVWTPEVRNQIIGDRGSVQKVGAIPSSFKELYKTVWEIKQKAVIDQVADRGAFICQSQSLNIHMAEPTTARLTSMHFYAWKRGLKTGMYYLRSLPKADAIQFTVDQSALATTRAAAPTPAAAAGKGSAPTTSGATQGLAFEEKPACESCSA